MNPSNLRYSATSTITCRMIKDLGMWVESSNGPTMHLLWAFEEVQAAIRKVAKSIDDLYSENQAVNLVPVLIGAMPFCSGLAMELERLTPGKWCIAPVFVSTYLDDGLVREPMVEFPSKFSESIDPNSPVVIIDDLLDTGTTMGHLVQEFKRGGFAEVTVCVLCLLYTSDAADE